MLGGGGSGDPNSPGPISPSLDSAAAGTYAPPTMAQNPRTGPSPSVAMAPGSPETGRTQPPEEQAQALLKDAQELLARARDEIRANREHIAEFNFQTISVILGLLTLVIAIPFVLLHGANIATGVVVDGIFLLLFADSVMAAFWMYLWWKRTLGRPPT